MTRGSIRRIRRSDGIHYEVVVDIGIDPVTGRRRQRSRSFRSYREAVAGRTRWLSDLDEGTAVERSVMTVAELLRYWLETYATHNVRAITLAGYRGTIERHIIPALGAIRIQALTPQHLQRFYSARAKDGLSRRVIQLCPLRLNQALKMAAAQGMVPRNVAEAVRPLRIDRREQRTWSPEQCRSFLDVATDGSAYGPIWPLALATGMRRGELLGVRWRDLDMRRGTLSVRQSVVSVEGHAVVSPHQKTDSSRRTIPLTARIVAAFQKHRARQLERRLRLGELWQDYDLVFASEVGTPIMPRNLIRDYDRLVKLAGVPRIRIHDLRHTYATVALGTGAAIRDVSDILGHADGSTTIDIYGHTIPGRGERLVSAIEDIIYVDDEGGEDEGDGPDGAVPAIP